MLSGFHPTGTVGTLCSAAASAKVLGLDETRSLHALAIGATQAAGLYCASKSGAMVKRMHAGRAAQSGVIAALLAAEGFTGSDRVLEDENGGFMATLADGRDLEPLVSDLGKRWYTSEVGFKAYAACASAHTIVDALDELMQQGLRAEDVGRVLIRLSRIGMNNVGWHYHPNGIVAAQMNAQFTAATKLLHGDAFVDQYTEASCVDPRTLALIERISVEHDPDLDLGGAAMRHAAKVQVHLRNGATLRQHVEQRRGSSARPLTETEVLAKFERLACHVVDSAGAQALRDELLRIDESPHIGALACAMHAGSSAGTSRTEVAERRQTPRTHDQGRQAEESIE
jgi:2-methylcitrate dehydratase PrpD